VPSSNAIPEPRTAAAISQRAPADANGSWRGSTDRPLVVWSTPEDSAPKLRCDNYRGRSSIPAPITATGRLEKSVCNLKLIACWDVAIMLGNPVPASTKDQCGIPT
jgi:hypothetical protein